MSENDNVREDEVEVVLVVDDDQLVVDLLTRTLSRVVRRVVTATSSEEAHARMTSGERIDVVVGDFTLESRGDGLEVLSEARDRHPDAARILMSGFVPAGTVRRAIADGLAHEFVPKPFGPDRFESIVRTCTSRRAST